MQNKEKVITARSKVDAWIIGVLLLSAGIVLWTTVPRALQGDEECIMALVSIGVCSLLIAGIGFPCRYSLKEDHLFIQSGVIKHKIPYADIQGGELSSNPLSSPAWSLQRIKITHKKGGVLTSPVNREVFLNELLARVPSRNK